MEFDKEQNHANGTFPEYGAIFMASGATKSECQRWRIFGLPSSLASFVKQVKVGMLLFLFDFEKRQLHGVFQARSDGAMNIVSHAFSSSGRTFPAQVKFTVLWHCTPLSEEEFGEVIQDNYFTKRKFNFGLSEEQVHGLLSLFGRKRIKMSIPKKQLTKSMMHGRFTHANGDKDERHLDSGQHSINDGSGANDISMKVERVPIYDKLALSERIRSNPEGKSRVGSCSFNWHLRKTAKKLNLSGETEDFPGDHGMQNKNRPIDSLKSVGRSTEELRNAPDHGKLPSSERLKGNCYEYGACWPNSSNCVPVQNRFNLDAFVYSRASSLGAPIHTSQPGFSSALSKSIELPQYIPCSMSTEDSYTKRMYRLYNKASSVKYGNSSTFQGYHTSESLQEVHPLQKSTVESIYPCREKQPPPHHLGADLANGILKSSSLLQNQVPSRTIIDHENLLTTDERFSGHAFHENPTFQPYGNEGFGGSSFSLSSPVHAPLSSYQIPPPHIFGHSKNFQSDHIYDAPVPDTCLHNIQYGEQNWAYGSDSLLQDSYDHLLEYKRGPATQSAAGYLRLDYGEERVQYSETKKSMCSKIESVFTRLALPPEMQLQEKDFSSCEDDVDASPDEIMAMLQLRCHRTQWMKGNKSSMHMKNKHHGKRASFISIKSKSGYPEASPDKLGMGSILDGDHQVGDGPFLDFKRRSEVRKAQNQINAEDSCETLSTRDGEMVEEERPFLDLKSRSKVQNAQIQSNAEGCNVTLTSESPSVMQVKRRKLIRPSFGFNNKGASCEGCNETTTGESPSVSQVKRRRLIGPNFSSPDEKGAPEEDCNETSTSESLSFTQVKRKKLTRPNLSSDKKEAPDEKVICASDSQLCELKSHECWVKTEGNNDEVFLSSQNTCNQPSPGYNDKPGPNTSGEKNSSIYVDSLVDGDESSKEASQDFRVEVLPLDLLCEDKFSNPGKDTSCKNSVADGSGKESSLVLDQAISPFLLLQGNMSTYSDESLRCKDMVAVASGEKRSRLTRQPVILDSSAKTCGDGKSGQMVDQTTDSSECSPAELLFIPLGDPIQSEMPHAGIDDISSKSEQCSNFEAVSKEKECELSLCLGRPIF